MSRSKSHYLLLDLQFYSFNLGIYRIFFLFKSSGSLEYPILIIQRKSLYFLVFYDTIAAPIYYSYFFEIILYRIAFKSSLDMKWKRVLKAVFVSPMARQKIPCKMGIFFWFVFFGQAKKMNKVKSLIMLVL